MIQREDYKLLYNDSSHTKFTMEGVSLLALWGKHACSDKFTQGHQNKKLHCRLPYIISFTYYNKSSQKEVTLLEHMHAPYSVVYNIRLELIVLKIFFIIIPLDTSIIHQKKVIIIVALMRFQHSLITLKKIFFSGSLGWLYTINIWCFFLFSFNLRVVIKLMPTCFNSHAAIIFRAEQQSKKSKLIKILYKNKNNRKENTHLEAPDEGLTSKTLSLGVIIYTKIMLAQ